MSEPIDASKKQFATRWIRAHQGIVSQTNKENRMKLRKIFAVAVGSLTVLALSMPVWSQDTTQSTTTTTQTPSAPQTTTTTKTKDKTKVKHHKSTTTEKQKTTTTTKPGPEQTQSTTTTTTTPQ
jgi:hypothetical protein